MFNILIHADLKTIIIANIVIYPLTCYQFKFYHASQLTRNLQVKVWSIDNHYLHFIKPSLKNIIVILLTFMLH